MCTNMCVCVYIYMPLHVCRNASIIHPYTILCTYHYQLSLARHRDSLLVTINSLSATSSTLNAICLTSSWCTCYLHGTSTYVIARTYIHPSFLFKNLSGRAAQAQQARRLQVPEVSTKAQKVPDNKHKAPHIWQKKWRNTYYKHIYNKYC